MDVHLKVSQSVAHFLQLLAVDSHVEERQTLVEGHFELGVLHPRLVRLLARHFDHISYLQQLQSRVVKIHDLSSNLLFKKITTLSVYSGTNSHQSPTIQQQLQKRISKETLAICQTCQLIKLM